MGNASVEPPRYRRPRGQRHLLTGPDRGTSLFLPDRHPPDRLARRARSPYNHTRRIPLPVIAGGGLPDPRRVRTRDDTRAPVLAIENEATEKQLRHE